MGGNMPNKFKQLIILTALVVLFTASLVTVKSLNIEPKLVVSGLTNLAAQLCAYLNNCEFLHSINKIFAGALVLMLVIIRASMIKIAAS
jgi:hypothetical protein